MESSTEGSTVDDAGGRTLGRDKRYLFGGGGGAGSWCRSGRAGRAEAGGATGACCTLFVANRTVFGGGWLALSMVREKAGEAAGLEWLCRILWCRHYLLSFLSFLFFFFSSFFQGQSKIGKHQTILILPKGGKQEHVP